MTVLLSFKPKPPVSKQLQHWREFFDETFEPADAEEPAPPMPFTHNWSAVPARCLNYTCTAILIAAALWFFSAMFVAFHSGRVHQILADPPSQAHPATEVK